MRGQDFPIPFCGQGELRDALNRICAETVRCGVGVILPMEWPSDEGRYNLVQVISPDGRILGRQCKTQIAPEEEGIYIPGRGRQIFEIGGVKFGVAICHEGWRCPETVRWAASRGAKIVFHPQCTGSGADGRVPRT
jgi:predicted amidohydrolase